VRLRAVRRVARFAGAAFFAALRRRFLAGAFFAVVLRFAALRRFLAGAFFFAALRRFLAGAAFFLVARFLVAFFAVDFRLVALRFVALRLAGAFFAALRRLAGAFLAAFLFVAFFAGARSPPFSESSHSGKFELRVSLGTWGSNPRTYAIRSCSRASSARTPR
jgi:hypothetical protein